MRRIKAPAGGDFSPAQWAALDEAAEKFADGTLRITSRQGIQYHHVYGPGLAPLVRHLNRNYRGAATLGACGDVNRNVMTSPTDDLDPRFESVNMRQGGYGLDQAYLWYQRDGTRLAHDVHIFAFIFDDTLDPLAADPGDRIRRA